MLTVRCRCGKIVCQLAHVEEIPRVEEHRPDDERPAVVILCRHCKSYMALRVPAIEGVTYLPGGQTSARPAWDTMTRTP